MEHSNAKLRLFYFSLGRQLQKELRDRIAEAGYEHATIGNWLALRASVPVATQPLVAGISQSILNKHLQNFGMEEDAIRATLFNKGATTVRAQRELRNLTQEGLAQATGLSNSTISNIESAKNTGVTLHSAKAIAKFFNLPLEAFKEFN